jgi:hypothetical protein
VQIDDKSQHKVTSRKHPGEALKCPIISKSGSFLLGRGSIKKKMSRKTLQFINLEAPQIVGEGSALGIGKRGASIVAVTEVVAYVLNKSNFVKYIAADSYGQRVMNQLIALNNRRKEMVISQLPRQLHAITTFLSSSRNVVKETSADVSEEGTSLSGRAQTAMYPGSKLSSLSTRGEESLDGISTNHFPLPRIDTAASFQSLRKLPSRIGTASGTY